MGLVYAEIELINGADLALARRRFISDNEVRKIRVNAKVDLKVMMLVINETIQRQLAFPLTEKRTFILSDGSHAEYDVVAPVELHFKNRSTTCSAIVLPGDSEPIMGSIPFYDMDVLIHPQRQELIVNPDHPYFAQMKMK